MKNEASKQARGMVMLLGDELCASKRKGQAHSSEHKRRATYS